ncbi:hypothetical protein CQW23_24450 [Capsicum baccatum]|uniref:Endonuclease/exonuclease/phosphatase domain-containing protein n=1 Tax=Capsicum baccatum TaxID=33114 RepID=A0A2G2VUS9_CAPBA|nr:hypothetical protein CQW23_24450 [Capsicum baccatum]
MEVKDFNDFMVDAGIFEMNTTGRGYTWSNRHTYSKIDRAVVNEEWVLNFPYLETVVMVPGISDHSPLSIELDNIPNTTYKAFRLFNAIAGHPEFLNKMILACGER